MGFLFVQNNPPNKTKYTYTDTHDTHKTKPKQNQKKKKNLHTWYTFTEKLQPRGSGFRINNRKREDVEYLSEIKESCRGQPSVAGLSLRGDPERPLMKL